MAEEYDEDFVEANQLATEEEEEEGKDDETEDEDLDEQQFETKVHLEVAKKERQRLRQLENQKKQMLVRMRDQQNQLAADGEELQSKQRLQFLLKQAEIFQHFGGAAIQAEKPKGRGRRKEDEDDEDAQLLADEDDDGETAGHRLQVQPKIISGAVMREYQLQGLNWLIHLYDHGINGILADEMGLGKTLQTISLIGYLHEFRGIKGPHLVIVPKSVMGNWRNEFNRFAPTIKVALFHGNAEERNILKETTCASGKFDVIIASFEMVIKEKTHFRKFHWRYVIIDEAHRIKNENSLLSKTVRLFRTNYRLLITGTPLQNNLHELWALLNFLLPEVFHSSEKFEEWFSLGDGGKEKEAEVVQQLHKVLRPFLLRRIKTDVERSLPPKKETILKIGMTEMQRKWYAGCLQKDIAALQGTADRAKLLNVVMQLRKCCNHPYLFPGAEPGPPFFPGDHLFETSGKMFLMDKLLPKLKARDSRVLVFSQMTRMLDILEDYCLYRGYKYCRIDGNTSGEDREDQIDTFNAEGSEKFIFLLSTRAGGLGINLATADTVVLYDSDWNPQMDLQAMDRAHRIGQKKEVQVFRLCVENSIEEKVIEKAYKKLRLDALVIQQGRLTENSNAKVNKDDLLNMVRYGAEMVFSSEAINITDADVEAIIAKGEKDTKALNDKLSQFTENAKTFAMDGGMVYDFKDGSEDKDTEFMVDGLNLKAAMAANWIDPPKRERKRANYNEADFYRSKGVDKGRSSGGPRLPKMPQLQDFQFFDTERLQELFTIEHAYELHKHSVAEKERLLKSQGASDEAIAKETDASADDPPALSEEEVAEKERLLTEGFSTWTRRDFNAFVRACEKFGRGALPSIAAEVDGKTEEEVRAYSKAFWQHYKELNDWEKVFKNIERGEQKIQRQQDIMNAIASKLEKYKNPWQDIKLTYGTNKGKAYTDEEDRFILCMAHKLGYGNWDDMKAQIRASWRFRFDWFFKSRTAQELSRRCDTLIRLIEKEDEESTAAGRGGGGGKKKESVAASGSREGSLAPSGGAAAGKRKTDGGGGTDRSKKSKA